LTLRPRGTPNLPLHKSDHYGMIIIVLLCWLGRTPTFMVPINPPFANSQHLDGLKSYRKKPLVLCAFILGVSLNRSFSGLPSKDIKKMFNNHPSLTTKQDVFEHILDATLYRDSQYIGQILEFVYGQAKMLLK